MYLSCKSLIFSQILSSSISSILSDSKQYFFSFKFPLFFDFITIGHFVQVPEAVGNLILNIVSNNELFPLLWSPTTVILG